MSPARAFAAAGIAFLLLLAIAVGWDSVRTLRHVRTDLDDVDRELRMHEDRVVAELGGAVAFLDRASPDLGPWSTAADRPRRHTAYRALVATIRGDILPVLDARDPTARRLADGIAGALNRRDVALRQYEDRAADCRRFAATFRGRVAARLMTLSRPCDD